MSTAEEGAEDKAREVHNELWVGDKTVVARDTGARLEVKGPGLQQAEHMETRSFTPL